MFLAALTLAAAGAAAPPALPLHPAPAPPPGRAALDPDGPDPALLPAETRFVVHVDLHRLEATRLFAAATGPEGKALGFDPDGLDEAREELGIDPLKDIRSVTIFGTLENEEEAVLLVRGTRKLDHALEQFASKTKHERVEAEGLVVDVFHGDANPTYVYTQVPEDGDEEIVVASNTRKELVRAALVLQGRRTSLAQADGPHLDLDVPSSAFLHVAFTGPIPGLERLGPDSEVFRLVHSGFLTLGEEQGNLALHVGVRTGESQDAEDVVDAIEGFRAFGRLLLRRVEDAPPEARDLLQSVKVARSGNLVTLDLSYPVEDMLRVLRESEQH